MTLLTSKEKAEIIKKVNGYLHLPQGVSCKDTEETITETELATIKAMCRWVRKKEHEEFMKVHNGKVKVDILEGYIVYEKDLKGLGGMK